MHRPITYNVIAVWLRDEDQLRNACELAQSLGYGDNNLADYKNELRVPLPPLHRFQHDHRTLLGAMMMCLQGQGLRARRDGRGGVQIDGRGEASPGTLYARLHLKKRSSGLSGIIEAPLIT